VQSPIFRLFSAFITLALFVALIAVIWLVVQNDPPASSPASALPSLSNARMVAAEEATANPMPLSTGVDATATSLDTPRTVTMTHEVSATHDAGQASAGAMATPFKMGATNRAATPTTTFAILQPTATPTPLTALDTPLDLSPSPSKGWTFYSNGNYVVDLTVLNNTIWAATGGGVVAWNRSNNAATRYSTLDGLAANRTTAVVNCPLPGFGLIFGTAHGLQIYDTRRERWTLLNSGNSEMHHDDVATLNCSVDDGFLVVGYREHGLDIFDTESGEWQLIDRRSGLQSDVVDAVTVVGDLAALWVSSGNGISVLTQDGVLFYDETTTPLETNAINVMVSDDSGAVWLGAQGKVYAINGETWTIYSPSYVLASQFPTGAITALALSGGNTLWIGSDRGELCKFDLVAVTCEPFFTATDLAITSAITALTVDNVGRLYVATAQDGVHLYEEERGGSNRVTNSANSTQWRTFTIPSEIRGNHLLALSQDAAGYLWLLTEAGLQQWDPASNRGALLFTDTNSRYPISSITTLTADPETGIWVGGQNAGYFDGTNWTTFATTDGLVNRQVRTIAIDGEQRSWFGTEEGLSIWNGDSFFNLTQADGLPGNVISAFLVDGNAIWIGTDNGLLRFAENRLQIFTTATTRLPSNRITALARDEEGAILIGTEQGLARFLAATMSLVPELSGQSIQALAVLPGNAIWVATESAGIRYFNGLQWTTPPDITVPPAPAVNLFFVDQQATLWIGTEGGLLRYVP